MGTTNFMFITRSFVTKVRFRFSTTLFNTDSLKFSLPKPSFKLFVLLLENSELFKHFIEVPCKYLPSVPAQVSLYFSVSEICYLCAELLLYFTAVLPLAGEICFPVITAFLLEWF